MRQNNELIRKLFISKRIHTFAVLYDKIENKKERVNGTILAKALNMTHSDMKTLLRNFEGEYIKRIKVGRNSFIEFTKKGKKVGKVCYDFWFGLMEYMN